MNKRMKERVMIGSLAFSFLLMVIYGITDYGGVLAYAMIGLLVSFITAMTALTEK